MLSVVIPTLDAARQLPAAAAALTPGVAQGLVKELIVSDGGSSDQTLEIADALGARIVRGDRGRGRQLAAGAGAARAPWLLFLHADTVLEMGWERHAARFMERAGDPARAAAFTFAFDDDAREARAIARWVARRNRWLGLPYGDQGLLISRAHYDSLGGFRPLPLMEDVDLARRIGRRALVILEARAFTSADKYRRDGWRRRAWRNLGLVALFYLGVAPERIARLYD